MKLHERFNRTWLSRFLNSRAGRVFRVIGGTGFILVGALYFPAVGALASMVWGLLALHAGSFDRCYFSVAMGGPFRGDVIREWQRAQ